MSETYICFLDLLDRLVWPLTVLLSVWIVTRVVADVWGKK